MVGEAWAAGKHPEGFFAAAGRCGVNAAAKPRSGNDSLWPMTPAFNLMLGVLSFALPISAIAWLGWSRPFDRWDALQRIALTTGIVALFVVAAPWSFLSQWLRPITLLALAAFAARAYVGRQNKPVPCRGVRITSFVLGLGAWSLAVAAFAGNLAPEPAARVTFPLRGGIFTVLQGGGSRITNPFRPAKAESRWALDLIALTIAGNRAKRLIPEFLDDYAIFGRSVLSPCKGIVVKARGDLPDNPPGQPNRSEEIGNYLTLRCPDAGILVTFGHLQRNSARVAIGEAIDSGREIASVGNSGSSLEPHLHVAATWLTDNRPAPLVFDGRFLSTNDLMFR
jgi:hypothetical protein